MLLVVGGDKESGGDEEENRKEELHSENLFWVCRYSVGAELWNCEWYSFV
jgi:hypothetical protein